MATSTYGTPYVQGSDLVSAYPTASSNLATRVDEVSYKRNGLNAQTGTTYTLVAGDAGKTITLSNAAAVAVTLPQDSVATLPSGAVVSFYNLGAGTVTISQGTGATLNGGSITLAQYEVTSVIKLSANTYGRYDGAPAPGLSQVTPTSIANSGGTATLTGGAVSFSAVTTVSLNGIFTSSYDVYRIEYDGSSSGANRLNLRLRLSGTDASGATDYDRSMRYASGNNTAATDTVGSGAEAVLGYINATGGGSLDVFRPFTAVATHMICHNSYTLNTGTYLYGVNIHKLATAYDGFSLISASGTITGVVRVYGYRNA